MIRLLIAAWCTALILQAQPPRDTRPVSRASGTASISGIVMSDEAQPKTLRRARVLLNGSALEAGRTVITDDDGRFRFAALPAGHYGLGAVKDGYVAISYGSSRSAQEGSRRSTPTSGLSLAEGETRSVSLRLPHGAVITGVVTGSDGQPAQGIGVEALASRYIAESGERQLLPAGVSAGPSDDRGIYRIFGLPAGDYVVAARQPSVGHNDIVVRTLAAPKRNLTLASVFFPSTTDVAHAAMVSVGAGEERSGADLQLQYVPLAVVAGSVTTPPGTPETLLSLMPVSDMLGDLGFARFSRAHEDGRHIFLDVAPGQYVISARADGPSGWSWGTADVVVDGEDVPNVALTTFPELTISGRIVFDGSSTPFDVVAPVALPLRPPDAAAGAPDLEVRLESGGRFTVPNIEPGIYRTRIGGLRGIRTPIGPWWLKSVVANGRDLLDGPFDVRQSADDAVVTFSDRASEVSGTVKDAQGVPDIDLYVVAFSTDSSAWFFNSRRVAGVRPGADGHYSVRNLPPGDYRIVANADLDTGEWFDPLTLQRLLPAATLITVSGTGKTTHDFVIRN